MTEHFNVLSKEEYKQLTDAIAQITVLIAGADDKIEPAETAWAKKIMDIRSYTLPDDLKSFYQDVGVDFADRLDFYVDDYDHGHEEAMHHIADDLAKLNPILAKLDQRLGYELYTSFKSFAKHVAKSTGGFFGFFSIGPNEAKWIGLDMLTPIEEPEADEDNVDA